MNNLTAGQKMWYWKRFYWKLFSTVYVSGAAGIVSGLAVSSQDIFDQHIAILVIFWLGVGQVVVKSIDSLIDQTFAQLVLGKPMNGDLKAAQSQPTGLTEFIKKSDVEPTGK